MTAPAGSCFSTHPPYTRCYAVHSGRPRWFGLRSVGGIYGEVMIAVPPFNPDAGPPGYLYVAVADHIAARIAVGELRPGARLPGERELAEEYQVALTTGRRAIQELRDRGLVVTLPAKGPYVVDRATS